MLLTMSFMTITTLTLMVFMLTTKLSKKKKFSREKNNPFECGFSQISPTRNSFSIHFFIMAMLFLIFDIEISLLLPMMSTKMINLKEWMLTSTMIMMILTLGLLHEWNNNLLDWKK